jgi:hypothetical protein
VLWQLSSTNYGLISYKREQRIYLSVYLTQARLNIYITVALFRSASKKQLNFKLIDYEFLSRSPEGQITNAQQHSPLIRFLINVHLITEYTLEKLSYTPVGPIKYISNFMFTRLC